jgi:hypothetical protein
VDLVIREIRKHPVITIGFPPAPLDVTHLTLPTNGDYTVAVNFSSYYRMHARGTRFMEIIKKEDALTPCRYMCLSWELFAIDFLQLAT